MKSFDRPTLCVLAVAVACVASSGCAGRGARPTITSSSYPQKSATRQSPGTEMKFNVARAKEAEGSLLEALEIYRGLYAMSPEDAQVCHRLGVALVQTGQIDDGITYLMEADALTEADAEIKGDLGYAYIQAGEYKLAETFLRESLDLDPGSVRSTNNLALAVGFQGRTGESYSLYRGVMSDAEAIANLGYIHTQRGETDYAIRRYNEALTKDPELSVAAEGLVQIADLKMQIAKVQREAEGSGKIKLATAVEEAE